MAGGGPDPQWITVDLQAPCRVESVVLVFEATISDPEWVPAPGSNPYNNTTGWEIMSSCATAFQLDVSTDGTTWTTVYQTTSGTGGVMQIPLAEPVTARWVRMTATQQSNRLPAAGQRLPGLRHQRAPPPAGDGLEQLGRPAPGAAARADHGTRRHRAHRVRLGADLDAWAETSDGATLSTSAADTAGWVSATVPGTVLASLVEQGHFPDPVEGYNNLHVPEALSRHSWWYRRPFACRPDLARGPGGTSGWSSTASTTTPRSGSTGPRSARSPIRSPVASSTSPACWPAASRRWPCGSRPMPHPGSPGDKGPNGVSFVNSSEVCLDFPSYLSVSGWDWMPAVRDRVAGIWNHVRLRSTGPAVLGDPRVDTSLPRPPGHQPGRGHHRRPGQQRQHRTQAVTVTAALGDVRVSTTVSVPAGGEVRRRDVLPADFPALRVSNPACGGPTATASPALHDLVMTASVAARSSDRRTRRLGLRQVDYAQPCRSIDCATDRGTQTENFPVQQARYLRI